MCLINCEDGDQLQLEQQTELQQVAEDIRQLPVYDCNIKTESLFEPRHQHYITGTSTKGCHSPVKCWYT
jgi:hypothetical protein